ncbi:hypothetical protein IDZ74_29365 [Pseudomonas aeruginosa]|uniref:hypothetical protein n=1 Tax=Pseudomonas aeruginosa TaxID=287 RepID=UPI001ADCD9CB|nr:hypothetical protein [Pseudomonas aeruginosa]MBO8406756.1 hypothetical protein [Pseudomonas aeruginosa]
MTAPRDGHAAEMTDAELERIVGVSAGFLASAPSEARAALERFRASACRVADQMDRELIEGRAPSVALVDLLAVAQGYPYKPRRKPRRPPKGPR